ncbi:MAG: response regulator [Acidobacteriota bacterium]
MPHRLLLADDSVTIQRVIELTFADEDIEVIAVGDGREAIRRIEADRPDIVLADVGMPEKDGYEVAAYVKGTPYLAHIPVLLLTGAFEPVDEQRAQQVGCDGVLAKPFEPQMVITRVNELLRGAAPPRAAMPPPQAAEPRAAASPAQARGLSMPPAAVPPAPGQAAALSPLDAFLASAPELDLAAFGTSPAAPVQPAPPSAESLTPPRETVSVPPSDTAGITNRQGAPPPADTVTAEPVSVRINRRPPIAVPGFGAPSVPQASTVAELDDYFDKLDAAFATLQQAPPRVIVSGQGMPDPSQPETLAASPSQWSTAAIDSAVAQSDARVADRAPAIAQAFSALLAAEHGLAQPGEAAPPTASAVPAVALPPASIDDLVERVVDAVLERMSDRIVRDVVTDIVSRVAEKLVREEIDRVKATIK